ncbi:hypothetical protein [Paracoccus sp. TOH]|uniref:hypothetical protein n=1 Tax=Paracoccus sp. TOH TaxID=1263728 RepID=UPI0025B0E2CC|nr:hypothetical protein [Paracoccus sp. TOH]WJS83691.1 hypothetical protein NBE95_07875 [Paracoccus sp. TOH]
MPLREEIVYSSSAYTIRTAQHPDNLEAGRPAVVTFSHAGLNPGNVRPGFAERWLRAKAVDGYFVLNHRTDWFQNDDFFPAIEAIRAHAGSRPLVTYGSSMGGYGALLGSGRLRAERVVAVVPQFSIERAVVPFEKRWRKEAEALGAFRHDVTREIHEHARITVILDPRNDDRHHLALYPLTRNWEVVALPFAGHMPLLVMQDARLLGGFVLPTLLGQPESRPPIRALLQGRRRSALYFRVLGVHAARLGRFPTALEAAARCVELGVPANGDKIHEVIGKLRPVRERLGKRVLLPTA